TGHRAERLAKPGIGAGADGGEGGGAEDAGLAGLQPAQLAAEHVGADLAPGVRAEAAAAAGEGTAGDARRDLQRLERPACGEGDALVDGAGEIGLAGAARDTEE